jgi:hypothetical protein
MRFPKIECNSAIGRLIFAGTTGSLLGVLTGCGGDPEMTRSERTPLVAVCAETDDAVPSGAWLCGSPRTVECDAHPGTASPAAIYVVRSDGCENDLLVDEGPFSLGEREIVVNERVAGTSEVREVCRSTLTVVDTTPPSAEPLRGALWPPNHKLHAFTAKQCAGAADICDPMLDVELTGATSDEVADAEGDGSHEPDIVFGDARSVSLRAERQGGGNGRVYTLGFRARDDSGNVAEGTCSVAVPHDSSGRAAVTDTSVYEVEAPD